jgi:hypothetical protein
MGASVFYESTSELATLQNTFTVNNAPTDPTDVTLTIISPTNATTTYTWSLAEIIHVSAGVFKKQIVCTEAGEWQYTWVGTVVAADVASGSWTVFPLTLGKLYATVDGLKSRLGIPLGTDTKDDYEIHMACFAASRGIEDYCGRIFYRSVSGTIRTFVPTNLYCLRMPAYNDIVSISAFKTDASGDGTYETTWASTDYQLLPLNATAFPEARGYDEIKAVGTKTFPLPYTLPARDDRVQVTGIFGWPLVPFAVKQAALILAEDIFGSKDSAFRVGGYSEFGRMRAKVNPHVVTMCQPYRRAATAFPVRQS